MANERRGSGLSSRYPHELATGGARADRVGVKLSTRAISSRGVVGQRARGPWPVTPRPALPARGGAARRARSGGMSGADVGGWGSGSNRRRAHTAVLHAHGNDRGAVETDRADTRDPVCLQEVQAIERSCSRVEHTVAEVDERRWPSLPSGARGSIPSSTRGERAPEAGSRRRSREHGGGFPSRPQRKRGGGSTRRWKALRFVRSISVDAGVARASLAFASHTARASARGWRLSGPRPRQV
jgi:hypothetical protein